MMGVRPRRGRPRTTTTTTTTIAAAAVVCTALALTGCAARSDVGSANGSAEVRSMTPPTVPEATAADDATEVARLIDAAGLPPCPMTSRAAPVADGLPELTLPCLGAGPDVTLSGLRGTPLVVNVWASWCTPCADEMPYLLAARTAVADRVRFLGVNLVDRRTAALAWAKDFGMTFPSAQDPDGVIRGKLRVPAPPATLFVRPDGRLAKIHYGAFTSERAVRGAIAEHLGVRA